MKKRENDNLYTLDKKQLRYLPIKRACDIVLSTGAIVVLSPLLLGIAVAIKLDSKGPIFFKQKRIGKNKKTFEIYKFRTMYIDTPSDKPTHLLYNPNRYITRVGKFLRKTSLDELPQLFNIIKGEMYIVSTRPALWNQYDLMEERDKYGVHQIAPGLTGWAQINGRDELEIPMKAKLDGEYIKKLSLMMDIKCILGTIGSVLHHDGVIEGGTGEIRTQNKDTSTVISPMKLKKEIAVGGAVVISVVTAGIIVLRSVTKYLKSKKNNSAKPIVNKRFKVHRVTCGFACIGTVYTIYVNAKRRVILQDNSVDDKDIEFNNAAEEENYLESSVLKKVLITGANSYIGMSVEDWLKKSNNKYEIDTIDMKDEGWKEKDFSAYDVVFHVAGIAHADVGNVTDAQKQLYYKVNAKLTVEVAEKAKKDGVKQFIFMSSMIVYSGCKEKMISKDTMPNPISFYGDSKWIADQMVRKLESPDFKVVVLRPPMIYGKGSKGNYSALVKLSTSLPVFPIVNNQRSMLYIDNLCQFIKLMIDNEETGVFFPQNGEYTNTSDMVQMIAAARGKKIIMIPCMSMPVHLLSKMPGKIGALATKAFGDSMYDMGMSEYKENYRVYSLNQSIEKIEKN